MAFLAYFGTLATLAAMVFGVSIALNEPVPAPSGKKVTTVAVTGKASRSPVRIAAEQIKAAPKPSTAAPDQAVAAEQPERSAHNAESTGQNAAELSSTTAPARSVKAAKAKRSAKAPARVREAESGETGRRYVGIVDGLPTYVTIR